ncbi:hypothetical protein [Nocardia wallacei]|uniref:hypothetical protein n=1 Tax=Nocardia wallacei TaxID=480035 RepID=UPI0024539C7F|nr:hypothetical protein [Nocardia wallacei]
MKPPSVAEVTAAMSGDVPEQHPAAVVLGAAFMLTRLTDWHWPDDIATSSGTPGSVLLRRIGTDTEWLLRTYLADLIDEQMPGAAGIGNAIADLARAWRAWQLSSTEDAGAHIDRAQDLVRARAIYVQRTAAAVAELEAQGPLD